MRRYVRDDADLPENDLILELPGSYSPLSCHIRHYVNADAHVVVLGEFVGGASGIVFAEPIAREVAEAVVPPGREFTMVAYAPQHPLSGKPHFHEVTFELDDSVRRPSSAVARGREGPCRTFVRSTSMPSRL